VEVQLREVELAEVEQSKCNYQSQIQTEKVAEKVVAGEELEVEVAEEEIVTSSPKTPI
jgi:hypothetical protein